MLLTILTYLGIIIGSWVIVNIILIVILAIIELREPKRNIGAEHHH